MIDDRIELPTLSVLRIRDNQLHQSTFFCFVIIGYVIIFFFFPLPLILFYFSLSSHFLYLPQLLFFAGSIPNDLSFFIILSFFLFSLLSF